MSRNETYASEIANVLEHAVTVADLIAELESMPPNARVVFVCNYGDYSRTQQALTVESIEELDPAEQFIGATAYSHSGLSVEDRDDDADDEDEDGPGDGSEPDVDDAAPVVILQGRDHRTI